MTLRHYSIACHDEINCKILGLNVSRILAIQREGGVIRTTWNLDPQSNDQQSIYCERTVSRSRPQGGAVAGYTQDHIIYTGV